MQNVAIVILNIVKDLEGVFVSLIMPESISSRLLDGFSSPERV